MRSHGHTGVSKHAADLSPVPLAFRTKRDTGRKIPAGNDGRSGPALRFAEISRHIEANLGGDPSRAKSLLVARPAVLALWLEDRNAEFARDHPFDAQSASGIACCATWDPNGWRMRDSAVDIFLTVAHLDLERALCRVT